MASSTRIVFFLTCSGGKANPAGYARRSDSHQRSLRPFYQRITLCRTRDAILGRIKFDSELIQKSIHKQSRKQKTADPICSSNDRDIRIASRAPEELKIVQPRISGPRSSYLSAVLNSFSAKRSILIGASGGQE